MMHIFVAVISIRTLFYLYCCSSVEMSTARYNYCLYYALYEVALLTYARHLQ